MLIPTRQKAETYLDEASHLNPGNWIQHSRNAASAAEAIARKLANLTEDTAYVLALLHDIGRRFGPTDLQHTWLGYQFLLSEGYDDAARICISHAFVFKDVKRAQGYWDGTEESLQATDRFLQSIEYDDYDRLVQLCDALSVSSGYWLIEKRLLDVSIRHGVYDGVEKRWQKMLEIRQHFDDQLGQSVYTLLPGVVENTFGTDLCNQGKEGKKD